MRRNYKFSNIKVNRNFWSFLASYYKIHSWQENIRARNHRQLKGFQSLNIEQDIDNQNGKSGSRLSEIVKES